MGIPGMKLSDILSLVLGVVLILVDDSVSSFSFRYFTYDICNKTELKSNQIE